jgi:hypothetical protein
MPVDNGKQLDHSEEAKLNEIVAVHQRGKDYSSKRWKADRDDLAQLKERKANREQLDHAEEAKLNKLVAAYQKDRDPKHEWYHNRTSK